MPSEVKLKFKKIYTILGPKTAILGPYFCQILVLGNDFWGQELGPPGSAPESTCDFNCFSNYESYLSAIVSCSALTDFA